jgi:hypothetical protein
MTSDARDDFERSVFINCPFDDAYLSLLRPLLFTVVFLGYRPRIASERSDAGEARLAKICQLIAASRYGIHDLSRLQASEADEFYRLNMPFELGIEYGCRQFSDGRLASKRCLVLETRPYDYMKALSDLAGSDIKSHDDDPVEVVRAVRNWFVETVGVRGVAPPRAIWYRFNDFAEDFYDARLAEGYTDADLDMMPVPEYIDFIADWVRSRA